MTEIRSLPLLAQSMRERGLSIADVTTSDKRYIAGHRDVPASVTVYWREAFENHHRRTANHVAQPVGQIEHRTRGPNATAHARADKPRIVQPDGSEQVYVVGKVWIDA